MADKSKGTVKEVTEAELKRSLAEGRDEKRTEPRLPAKLDIEVPLSTWEQVRRVYTTNISKGGMMFMLTPPASLPATLAIVLTLPDGQVVKLESEVRHVVKQGADFEVGVQFASLPPEGRAALESALSKLQG